MEFRLTGTVGLLLAATLVALVARRLRLPYTVGLVVTGVGLALFHVNTGLTLTRDLIYNALLPPLLFEAALSLPWRELKRDALPITLLATVGVAVSALVVAGGLAACLRWHFRDALVFGVLIAATDPVSVIALFKETRIVGRLRLLVEAESLLNDGVAAVLFALALAWATAPPGTGIGAGEVARGLATTVLGGLTVGALAGGLAIGLAGRTEDHLVETTLTTVAAYGSFLLAEHWHASGVLATVTAGVLMGNVGVLRGADENVLSRRGREVVLAFWEFAAFVANSLIFLLIGLRVARIPFGALGPGGLALAVGLTLLGRALTVYPLCGLLAGSRVRVSFPAQHALFWGGLRGALGLALALSLPLEMPSRDAIVIAAFGVGGVLGDRPGGDHALASEAPGADRVVHRWDVHGGALSSIIQGMTAPRRSSFLPLVGLFLLACFALPVSAGPAIPPLPPPVPASVHVRLPVVTPQMHRYSETGYMLYFVETAYGLLLLAGILATGFSARLRAVAERLPGGRLRFVALVWYYGLLTVLLAMLQAPLTFYGGFWRPHHYGLSHQGFGGWLADEAKGAAIDTALAILLFATLFALVRRSPRRWGLWLWLVAIPLVAFGIFAQPLMIDPLFNKFTPLPAGTLRTQIESLAVKAGIPDAPILVSDKSRQTDETNAYVTGIGSSARIVLWDTLLRGRNRMPDDQILAVVGHEMGHYVLKHLYLGFAEAVGGLLVALPLLQLCVRGLVRRFGARWGVTGLTDRAAVPAYLLVFGLLTFGADPISNALSRQIEHAADAYGLAVTQNRVAMAQAFVSLSEQNLSDPYPPPFIAFWLFTHPPLGERIAFALGRPVGPASQ